MLNLNESKLLLNQTKYAVPRLTKALKIHYLSRTNTPMSTHDLLFPRILNDLNNTKIDWKLHSWIKATGKNRISENKYYNNRRTKTYKYIDLRSEYRSKFILALPR